MIRSQTLEADEILDKYFPIHDHGFISLKDYMGSDSAIEEAARCSYSYGTRVKADQRTLIRSLMRRGHTSPFEQVELKFHVGLPIFVARQWIRHRTASLNEMSGRYSLMPMLFYTPEDVQVQKQSKWDKQGRDGALDEARVKMWKYDLSKTRAKTIDTYHTSCRNDFARELARIDLPLSTYTQWYWKCDLHNIFNFLRLRCDSHAQWEIRQFANVIAGMVKRVAPIAFEAWEDYTFYSRKFSRMEMEALRKLRTSPEYPKRVLVDAGHQCLYEKDLREFGLSKTEVTEFLSKFSTLEKINFDLDLSLAMGSEYFEEMYKKSAESEKG